MNLLESIKYLVSLGEPTTREVHGRAYAHGDLKPLPSPAARVETLTFHTLSGLVDYVVSGHDTFPTNPVLHVRKPTQVALLGAAFGDFRQREAYAVAEPFLAPGFPCGRYIDLETFVTMLQTSFVPNDERARVLRVVGNITAESGAKVTDDGVTQQVTARAGIQRLDNVEVPNPVRLRPYRVFSEISQPEASYVLRIRRSDEDSAPEAALFEVADTAWMNESMEDIANQLETLLVRAGSTKINVLV